MIDFAGWQVIEKFNRTNLDKPVAFFRLEACGFRIQNNFAHGCLSKPVDR
jgi:hypothetical protein